MKMEVNVKLLGDVKFEIGARSHTVVSDQPQENGGQDEGMTPPELFLASLGSCAAFYASAYLRKKGLARKGVAVRVTAEKAGPPARLDNFKIEVRPQNFRRLARGTGCAPLPDSQHAAASAHDAYRVARAGCGMSRRA